MLSLIHILTEQENRLPAVDGISFTRYPSIDAQTVEMTITKVQLGYMRVRNGSSSTEGSLIQMCIRDSFYAVFWQF